MLAITAHTPRRVGRHRLMVEVVVMIRCPQSVAAGVSIGAQDPSRTLPPSVKSQILEAMGALRDSHLIKISLREDCMRADAWAVESSCL